MGGWGAWTRMVLGRQASLWLRPGILWLSVLRTYSVFPLEKWRFSSEVMIAKINLIFCAKKNACVVIWVPFSGFWFLIDHLSSGVMCCCQNSHGLYQRNGCLTNYRSCCSWIFSKLFNCLRRSRSISRWEIIFPFSSQVGFFVCFFSNLTNVSSWCQTWESTSSPLLKVLCKPEDIFRLPCNLNPSSGVDHLRPCWRGQSVFQTILPSWFCRYHRGTQSHVSEYYFKIGRVDY